MKISLVSLRTAKGMPPAGPGAPVHGMAEPMRALSVPPRPAVVNAGSWELLAIHVDDAQRRSSIAFAPLRAVVQAVVRELRAGGESWDSVYSVLNSAVVAVPGGPSQWAREYEMYTSRSAALVAHMHSWADVERLAELEGESQAG